jgi:hypothetical protein
MRQYEARTKDRSRRAGSETPTLAIILLAPQRAPR